MPPFPSFIAIHGFTSGGAMTREPHTANLSSGGSIIGQPTSIGFGWRVSVRKTGANGTNLYIRQRTFGEAMPSAQAAAGHFVLWVASLPTAPQNIWQHINSVTGHSWAIDIDAAGAAFLRPDAASTLAQRLATNLAAGTFYRVEFIADSVVGGAGRASGLANIQARMTPGLAATPWPIASIGPTGNTATAPGWIEWRFGGGRNLLPTFMAAISDLVIAHGTTWAGQYAVHTLYPDPSFAAPSVWDWGAGGATHKEALLDEGHPTRFAGSWNDGTDYIQPLLSATLQAQRLSLTTKTIPSGARIRGAFGVLRNSSPSVANGGSFMRLQLGWISSAFGSFTVGTIDASSAANSNFRVPGLASNATNYRNQFIYGPPGIPSADAQINPADLQGYLVGPPAASCRISITAVAWYAAVEVGTAVTASNGGALASEIASIDAGVSATDIIASDAFTFLEAGSLIASLRATDTAAVGEAGSLIASLRASDAFTFADTASAVAALNASDTAAVAEPAGSLVAAVPVSDAFTFAEQAPSVVASLRATDVASLGEAGSLIASLRASDTGALASELPSVSAVLSLFASDAFTFADGTGSVAAALVATDTGAAADAGSLIASLRATDAGTLGETVGGIALAVVDAFTFADAGSLAASIGATDAGTHLEAGSLVAALAATDAGTAAEGGPSIVASLRASDTANLAAEGASLAAALAASDTAAAAEGAPSLRASIVPSDAFTFADTTTSLAATLNATDVATWTAVASVGAAVSGTDAGTFLEAGSLVASLSASDTANLASEISSVNAGLAASDLAASDTFAMTEGAASVAASIGAVDAFTFGEWPAQGTTTVYDFSSAVTVFPVNASAGMSGSAFKSAATSLAVWAGTTGSDVYTRLPVGSVPGGAEVVLQGWVFHPTGASHRLPILQHWDGDFSGLPGIDNVMKVIPSGWSHFTQRARAVATTGFPARSISVILRPAYNPAGAGWSVDSPVWYDDLVVTLNAAVHATVPGVDVPAVAEQGALSASLAASDALSWADGQGSVSAALGATESAALAELSAVAAAVARTDAGALAEVASLAVAASASDSSSATDLAGIAAALAGTDAATLIEVAEVVANAVDATPAETALILTAALRDPVVRAMLRTAVFRTDLEDPVTRATVREALLRASLTDQTLRAEVEGDHA